MHDNFSPFVVSLVPVTYVQTRTQVLKLLYGKFSLMYTEYMKHCAIRKVHSELASILHIITIVN